MDSPFDKTEFDIGKTNSFFYEMPIQMSTKKL